MTKIIVRNTARFILLILLQVFVFNHIELNAYLIPHIYVLFILLLPFETPKWLLLLLAFFLGLFMDAFSYSIGLHTAACTFMAFLRPTVQNLVGTKQEYVPGIQPGVSSLGFRWFFSYTIILVSAHHLILYFLEVFSFNDIIITLLHAILNIIFTTTALMLAHLLFYRPAK
jgi:rod shape-determining protein MreD